MRLHMQNKSYDRIALVYPALGHNIRKTAAFSCDVTYADLGRSRMVALGYPYDRLMQSLI